MERLPSNSRYNIDEILAILASTPSVSSRCSISSASSSSPSSSSSSPQTSSPPPIVHQKRRYCTWCGRGGHSKNDCTDLTVAFKMGVIHTRRGKICLIDGGKIPWPHGEKCLKDWVLRHGRTDSVEEYRRAGAVVLRQKKGDGTGAGRDGVVFRW